MMLYNEEYFDAGLYRMGTRCEKWDACRREHGEGALPMWVADMDFPSPPQVQQALLARAAHPTYGYTETTDEDADALIHFGSAAMACVWRGRRFSPCPAWSRG